MYSLKYNLENLYKDIRKSHNKTRDGHQNHSESLDELYHQLASTITIMQKLINVVEENVEQNKKTY